MPPTQFGNEHVSDLSVHPSASDSLAVGAVDGSVHRYARFTREKTWPTEIQNVRVCWADENIVAWGSHKRAMVLRPDGTSFAFETPEAVDLAVAGARLLIASSRGQLISYQLSGGRPHLLETERQLDGYKQRSLITSSRGAAAFIAGRLVVYQAKPDAKWQEIERSPQLIAFSRDGQRLACVEARPSGSQISILSVTEDGQLDVERQVPTFPVLATTVAFVEWSLDGGTLLIIGADGELEARDVQTTQVVSSMYVDGFVRSFPQNDIVTMGGARGLYLAQFHRARSKLWIARRAGASAPDPLRVVSQARMERGDEVLLFVDEPTLRPAAIYEVANGLHTDEEGDPPAEMIGVLRLQLPPPADDVLEKERDLNTTIAALSPFEDTRTSGNHSSTVSLLERLFSDQKDRLGRVIDASSSSAEDQGAKAHVRDDEQIPPGPSRAQSPLDPELRQFLPIIKRYSNVVRFIDVALVARLGPRNELIAARMTATSELPPEIHDESAGWIALRTALPIDAFEDLIAGLCAGSMKLGDKSYSFSIAESAHFSGFRTNVRGFGPPNRPVARAVCAGGPISRVLNQRELYHWRDHHLVVTSSFHDLENLRELLALPQTFQGDSDHRQVHIELEVPLDVRLLAFDANAFALSLRLAGQPSPLPLQVKLRNDATKLATNIAFDVSDEARVCTWTTRCPPGSRISLKLSDSELLLMEESFELHEAPSLAEPRNGSGSSGIPKVEPIHATRILGADGPAPMAELTGAIVGPWQLMKKIGAGGYGVVYEARHTVVHNDCAVKVISYDDDDKDVVLERLKRETRTSNEIKHRAILPIFDGGVDTAHRVAYAAMRRLTGHPLQGRVGTPMTEGDAWNILRPVTEALALCHAIGTVHRDVHPGNIFLTESGEILILDFGLCAIANRQRVTRSATTLGHLEYAAPEQIMLHDNEYPAATADVWSLGVVLYQLLTGRHPFQRATSVAIAAAAERDPHPAASTLGVRPELSAVIDSCLRKKADERYASAGEVLDAIKPLLGGN